MKKMFEKKKKDSGNHQDPNVSERDVAEQLKAFDYYIKKFEYQDIPEESLIYC
jgi:hypothetical protein